MLESQNLNKSNKNDFNAGWNCSTVWCDRLRLNGREFHGHGLATGSECHSVIDYCYLFITAP